MKTNFAKTVMGCLTGVTTSALLFSGCLLDGGGAGSGSAQLKVKLWAKQQALSSDSNASAGEAALSGYTVSDGINNLVITSVKMTLEDIDLERDASAPSCEDNPDPNNIECADFIDGPALVNLDLTGRNATTLVMDVQPGVFEHISFDISVPDGGDQHQLDYFARHPEMKDVSVLVEGSFNGTPFVFRTAVRGDQELALSPALVIEAPESSGIASFDLNLYCDLSDWFKDSSGNLVDPTAICELGKSCSVRTIVEDNIRRSIESGSAGPSDHE